MGTTYGPQIPCKRGVHKWVHNFILLPNHQGPLDPLHRLPVKNLCPSTNPVNKLILEFNGRVLFEFNLPCTVLL